MNKKILNIVVSLLLFTAFFMPWIIFFGFNGSGLDVIMRVFENPEFVEKNPEILFFLLILIFPLSAIITFLIYLKNEIKKADVVFLHLFKKLPLVFLILVIVFLVTEYKEYINMIGEGLKEVIGLGLIIIAVCSIILFIDQPKSQSFILKSPDLNPKVPKEPKEYKEEANTENLFD